MNVGTMVATAALLLVACSPAQAQSQDGQSLRDILNRAQSQSDRKAVEDLIGKLRGPSPAQPAPPAQPTGASAPSTTPESAPASTTADTAAPASMPSDLPVASETPAPNATTAAPSAPPSAPPLATAPTIDSMPAVLTESPAAATTTATSAPETPGSTSPSPPSPPPSEVTAVQPAATPTSAPAIHPVGAPIGPAEAVPTPIGPSEAEVARAPQIALEKGLPNVDIEVLFGYDSSQITPAAAESLLNLGHALNDPRLAGQRFVIAGHTDARGSRAYNGALSQRRAQSVRQFLIEHFKIAPDNLVARGFGETQLKNPRNPRGPENRRVQVINWTGQTAVQNRR